MDLMSDELQKETAHIRDQALEDAAAAVWQYKADQTISRELMMDLAKICKLVRNMKSTNASVIKT